MVHRLDECFSSGFPGCSATPGRPRKSQGNPFSWKISWRQSAVRGERYICQVFNRDNWKCFLERKTFHTNPKLTCIYCSDRLPLISPILQTMQKSTVSVHTKTTGLLGLYFPSWVGGLLNSKSFVLLNHPKIT